MSDERTIDIVAAPRVQAAGVLAGVPAVARAVEHDGRHPRDARPGRAARRRRRHRRCCAACSPAGISIERVTPVTRSLEDQFLSMTTRLENA